MMDVIMGKILLPHTSSTVSPANSLGLPNQLALLSLSRSVLPEPRHILRNKPKTEVDRRAWKDHACPIADHLKPMFPKVSSEKIEKRSKNRKTLMSFMHFTCIFKSLYLLTTVFIHHIFSNFVVSRVCSDLSCGLYFLFASCVRWHLDYITRSHLVCFYILQKRFVDIYTQVNPTRVN